MKTQFTRVMMVGLAMSSFVLCAGCEEDKVAAEVPIVTATPANRVLPAEPLPSSVMAAEDIAPPPMATSTNAPGPSDLAKPNPATARPPAVPENVKLSPALAEVVKLVQAGVNEDVIMTYVANSTNVFQIGADEIVYLNDLGISPAVMTTLIQQDASPDALARKQAAGSVKPLSPNLVLTTPATNVYPNQITPPTAANAPEASMSPPAYVAPPPNYAPTDNSQPPEATAAFYTSLAPYGNWIQVPDYGLCWQPTVSVVNSYWRPYADNGRWLWSDCGWYWYSDYTWGWAPFHYGRWTCPSGLGWIWIPDTRWGPAWVTWRYTPYYCGWAPLPPRCSYLDGFGLYYNHGSVGIGFGFGFGADYYTFIHWNRFCERYPHHYYVAAGQATTIYKDSTVINNYVVGNNNTIINRGVGLERAAKMTRGEIPKATIRVEPVVNRNAMRPERLSGDSSAPVIVRPSLTTPLIRNAAPVPTKSLAEATRPAPTTVKKASSAASSAPLPVISPSAAAMISRPASTALSPTPASSAKSVTLRPPRLQETDALRSATAPATASTKGGQDAPISAPVRASTFPGSASRAAPAAVGSAPNTPALGNPQTPPVRPPKQYPLAPSRLGVKTADNASSAAPAWSTRPSSSSAVSGSTLGSTAPALPSSPSVLRPASTPPRSARNDMYRSYAEPTVAANSAAPRPDFAPATASRLVAPARPQFTPGFAPAAPAYSSPPMPSRPEVIHSSPAMPSRAMSAPAASAPVSRASPSSASNRSGGADLKGK